MWRPDPSRDHIRVAHESDMDDMATAPSEESVSSIHDRFVRWFVVVGASSAVMQIANIVLFTIFGPRTPYGLRDGYNAVTMFYSSDSNAADYCLLALLSFSPVALLFRSKSVFVAIERWLTAGRLSPRIIELASAAVAPLALLTALAPFPMWDSGPFGTLYNIIHAIQLLGGWIAAALVCLCLVAFFRKIRG